MPPQLHLHPHHHSPQVRNEVENHGSALSIILFSLAVFTAVIGPAVILPALIFVFNTFERDGLEVRTSADLPDLRGLLTISQLVTIVVSKSVPIVMTVHAYQLAAKWLKLGSRRLGDCPSPLQLGLLISVLQGANIIEWIKVRWHLSPRVKRRQEAGYRTIPRPDGSGHSPGLPSHRVQRRHRTGYVASLVQQGRSYHSNGSVLKFNSPLVRQTSQRDPMRGEC